MLILNDGARTLFDTASTLISGQALEMFESVGLGSHEDRVFSDHVEVNEESTIDEGRQERFGLGPRSEAF